MWIRESADGGRPLAPRRLDEGAGGLASRLYFARFFAEEQRLAAALVRIASKPPRTLPEVTASLVEKLTGALHADELQTLSLIHIFREARPCASHNDARARIVA